jgi:hypothetical protein
MPVVTHPMGNPARALFDTAAKSIGAAKASRWFFSGHDELGGRSPIEALKQGDRPEVRASLALLIGGIMKVLVCGGRKFADRDMVWHTLDTGLAYYGVLTVIQGDCETGADLFAREWARRHEDYVDLISEPAQWRDLSHEDAIIRVRKDGTKYDAKAGIRRNQIMLEKYDPDRVLAFPGGKGTRDMVKRAEKASIKVKKVGWS